MTLPAGPNDLDAALLERALRDAGRLAAGSTIEGFEATRMSEFGGVNGETYRLHLRASGAAPASVVAKFPARSPAARGVAAYQHWYEREVRTYRELLPWGAMRAPACYLAEIDETGAFLLLLEDLGGLRQGDQLAGCPPSEAARVLDDLARWHARWWEGAAEAGDWLPRTTVGLERARPVQGALGRAWPIVREAYALPSALDPIAEVLVERYPELLERASSAPATVVHGDFRLDNMFLRGSGAEVEATVFDWQFACRCRGVYDVAYFLGLDLTIEDRLAHERPLLEGYVAALREYGVAEYSSEEAWDDYRLCLALGFAVFAIGGAAEQHDDRMRRVHEAGLHRLAAAMVDLDVGAVLRGP
ncbi:MAG: phosphotransferase [Dehalococcoidia bacterium]|nr:phosphotransferase [Dehalococcoidia bacterium]